MYDLAPVGISAYGRLSHLKSTIDALKKNTLANESDVYIFSDAPKEGDEEKVEAVRSYIQTIEGFRSVSIILRDTNNRIANNRGGIQQLLDSYGKCIFMEEDIVTAPGFLRFMNDALEFYRDDERILSISGYCPPINIKQKSDDVFVLPRFSAWGFGIWKEKYKLIDYINKREFDQFYRDKAKVRDFVNGGGEDMLHMLEMEVGGKIDALDVKAMYTQFIYNLLTVYPRQSLVQNVGHDGSGMHCGETNKFYIEKLWDKTEGFGFVDGIQVGDDVRKENLKFRRLGGKAKISAILKRVGLYGIVKKLLSIK